jgi:hypothetical protein
VNDSSLFPARDHLSEIDWIRRAVVPVTGAGAVSPATGEGEMLSRQLGKTQGLTRVSALRRIGNES